jgi:hypothetical protein
MAPFNSDKVLISLSAIFVFLSITFSFVSKHYESRVMGYAALGVAVLAPEKNSLEWTEKKLLRSRADNFFISSILFASLSVILNFWIGFRNPPKMPFTPHIINVLPKSRINRRPKRIKRIVRISKFSGFF